mmetsp:Transcript_26040/g.66233  ORF Transcript_26040/g.66233 Transcript_26040/m.66233 type:complete len:273 (-) Transcript_26040:2812-3630(-)
MLAVDWPEPSWGRWVYWLAAMLGEPAPGMPGSCTRPCWAWACICCCCAAWACCCSTCCVSVTPCEDAAPCCACICCCDVWMRSPCCRAALSMPLWAASVIWTRPPPGPTTRATSESLRDCWYMPCASGDWPDGLWMALPCCCWPALAAAMADAELMIDIMDTSLGLLKAAALPPPLLPRPLSTPTPLAAPAGARPAGRLAPPAASAPAAAQPATLLPPALLCASDWRAPSAWLTAATAPATLATSSASRACFWDCRAISCCCTDTSVASSCC